MKFKELSYANETDPLLKRLVIRSVENLSGRSKYVKVYKIWRAEVVGKSDRVFSRMLELIDIGLSVKGNWPPENLPDGPIVMVANHPYGVADGLGLGDLVTRVRPDTKIMTHSLLCQPPEAQRFLLPLVLREHLVELADN